MGVGLGGTVGRRSEGMSTVQQTQRRFSTIAILTFVAGSCLAVLGVVLVYLGSKGQTELNLFGQKIKSSNVGISAIFIGAVLIIVNINRVLDSVERLGGKASGVLTISEVIPRADAVNASCTLDFRVTNVGGSDISINGLTLDALDVKEPRTLGFSPYSHVY